MPKLNKTNIKHGESPFVQIEFNQIGAVKGVEIKEHKFLGHLNLRGRLDNSAFCKAVKKLIKVDLKKIKANTFITEGEIKVYWLGPDEWLILTPQDLQIELQAKLQKALKDIHSSVTDVSSGQTCIQISGTNARALIEKGCTIDLHPKSFRNNDCAQTHLAKATVLLSSVDVPNDFEIVVRRSFADYLGLWLLDSSLEFI